MDIKKADYMAFPGKANWEYGFALLHVVGSKVFPEIHRIDAGKTVCNGRVYPRVEVAPIPVSLSEFFDPQSVEIEEEEVA